MNAHIKPDASPQYPHSLPDSGPRCAEWVLDTVFGPQKPGAWITVVRDVDIKGQWTGGRYSALGAALKASPNAGHYVSVGIVKPGAKRRLNATTEAGACIFFDDVGEMGVNPNAKMDKAFLDTLGPTPTFVVATSEGNFQYFYAFSEPVPAATQQALFNALKADPRTRGGFIESNALVRYGRLPSGRNPKPGRGRFSTRLVEASGRKYSAEEIVRAFCLKLPAAGAASRRMPASQSPSGNVAGEAQKAAGGPSAAAAGGDAGKEAFERHVSDKAFFRQINNAALAHREKWVPAAFPTARPPTATDSAWRISSADLGRPDLVEDLSIHATGITWFGVHDLAEDVDREGRRTAINAILEHGPEDLRGSFDDMAAVMSVTLWLAEQLGLSDDDLKAMGWRGGETTTTPADPVDDAPPVDLWKAVDAPPLPVGLLPARVEAFVRANAKAIGGDPAGLAGASIAAMAAAIPDTIKLQVQAKGKKWLIAARIWIALLGGPSTKKTPIIKAALAAMEIRDWARRQHYTSRKALWEAQSKQAKADALARGVQPPPHNRLMIGDATPEAAADILATSPNGVLAYHDELSGFFGQMERYGKNGADRPFWLQARDGGIFSIDRKSSGSTYISHLSVTLVGGIQPEPMRKVAEGTADDGLIQRLTPIILRAAELTDDNEDTSAADQGFTDLIDALLALTPGAQPLRFDDGAQKIRREMEIEHHERTQQWENIQKKIASAFGKQDGVFAELCVIWHAAENANQSPLPDIVTEDTARRVATFMREFLRPHMIAFYRGALDLSDKHDELKMIAGYILTHKPETMNSREVQKSVWSMRRLGAREVASFMEQLEAFGWLFRHPPPRMGALPVWKVNPAIHVHFAEQAKVEAERRAAARATIAKDVAARKMEQSSGEEKTSA